MRQQIRYKRHHTRAMRASGFTLIEFIVVFEIMALLAIISITAGAEMLRTAKVRAAGSEVAFAFLRGRQNASVEHDNFFVILETNAANRVEMIQIVRDDGSGILEVGTDTVVRRMTPDQGVYLGDGRGSTTSLPSIGGGTYAVRFGPRGEARHPTTGAVLNGFVNITILVPERGGWVKFTAIDISPSGGVSWEMHREQV